MTAPERRRVELFVRSLSGASRTPANDHLETLRSLADNGAFDLTVSVWGREVELKTAVARTAPGRHVLDRVAAFRSWAEEEGVDLEPFFRTREVHSDLTGQTYTTLVLPATCLAEYRGDELVRVAPFATGTAVHSVADHVDRLRTDAVDDAATLSQPVSRAGD